MSAIYDPHTRYQNVTAHTLIAETAVAMAQEVYEELCSGSNAMYKVHGGDRDDFIRQCAPTLKAAAKVLLGSMLNLPNLSLREKERIFEALTLDNMLPKGGVSIVPIN